MLTLGVPFTYICWLRLFCFYAGTRCKHTHTLIHILIGLSLRLSQEQHVAINPSSPTYIKTKQKTIGNRFSSPVPLNYLQCIIYPNLYSNITVYCNLLIVFMYLYIYKLSWHAVHAESSPRYWPLQIYNDWRTCDPLAGTTYKWFSSDPRTSFCGALENIVPCTIWLQRNDIYFH